MIHLSFTGQGTTLCGEPQLEADLKDGKLCEDCITVMWKEQHRRNLLMPEIKKARKRLKIPIPDKLPPHRGIASKKLFLKDWKIYGERA